MTLPVHAAYDITYNAYGAWTLDKDAFYNAVTNPDEEKWNDDVNSDERLQNGLNPKDLWYRKDGTRYKDGDTENTGIPFEIRYVQ